MPSSKPSCKLSPEPTLGTLLSLRPSLRCRHHRKHVTFVCQYTLFKLAVSSNTIFLLMSRVAQHRDLACLLQRFLTPFTIFYGFLTECCTQLTDISIRPALDTTIAAQGLHP